MIDIRIDPVILRWDGLTLGWHGVWLVIGIAAAYRTVVAAGRREGIATEHLAELMVWTSLAGYAAARLFYVVDHWDVFAAEPRRILAVGQGGLSIFGGLLGGTAAGALVTRRKMLDFWRVADVVAIGIPVGEIVGRVGCAINGDAAGVPTGAAWGLVYWHPAAELPGTLLGVPTFPAPVALQLWNAALLVFLVLAQRRGWPLGSLFLACGLGYSLGRLLVSFWQVGEPFLWSLKQAQVVGLVVAVICAAGMAVRRRGGRVRSETIRT